LGELDGVEDRFMGRKSKPKTKTLNQLEELSEENRRLRENVAYLAEVVLTRIAETTAKNGMGDDRVVPLMRRRSKLLWPDAVTLDSLKPMVRQRAKIAEIRVALVEAGLVELNEQAAALGLSRSTAWSILKPGHKTSGLEVRTISRILRSPRLPSSARQRIFEYIEEKLEGLYGHNERRQREFAERLMAALRNEFKIDRRAPR
jgi:hypothetical protein